MTPAEQTRLRFAFYGSALAGAAAIASLLWQLIEWLGR